MSKDFILTQDNINTDNLKKALDNKLKIREDIFVLAVYYSDLDTMKWIKNNGFHVIIDEYLFENYVDWYTSRDSYGCSVRNTEVFYNKLKFLIEIGYSYKGFVYIEYNDMIDKKLKHHFVKDFYSDTLFIFTNIKEHKLLQYILESNIDCSN